MIRINNLELPLEYDNITLKKAAAKLLKIQPSAIKNISLYKRSVDARKKKNIHFIAAVDLIIDGDERCLADRCSSASYVEEYSYEIPTSKPLSLPPVIIGSGPCGLFAALILSQAGQKPILIERGTDVDQRTMDVQHFWSGGELKETSNVQFGEGGAGTFSDGKLNTGTKDHRCRKVLKEFVQHGAPEDILYLAKPHIGTDRLKTTVKNLRQDIIRLGGTVLFNTLLTGIQTENGKVVGACVCSENEERVIPTKHLILAIGHSARDTFEMLIGLQVAMEQKAFSMGVRIEHLQEKLNRQQYGEMAGHPMLGVADYKLAVHLPDGRGVYTFCMCPGGSVVAAASEAGRLATNGMSEYARDKTNANAAVLVGIGKNDFGSEDVLAGMQLQRKWEQKAFELGGRNYHAPVQRLSDFLQNQKSSLLGEVLPSYRPGYELTDLRLCLPDYIVSSLRQGIPMMDHKLRGFADGDAILTGIESRSSSPVRILRDETMQSVSLKGLYPCGEGAGYAGGIMSAAVDGIKAAEMILHSSNL